MAKIGDLFVRLGLTTENFKKGIEFAKNEIKNFGSNLKNMKAGALAVWAAVGTAVIKFAKDFISATNRMSDAWEKTMAGIKAQYHTFLAELSNTNFGINTEGTGNKIVNAIKNEIQWWKKLIGKVREAGAAAEDAAESFDQGFELSKSVQIQRKRVQQELNELDVMMRDRTLSPAERLAAADRYEALLKPIADAEVAIYGDMLDKAVTKWQAGTGLNRTKDEILEFFENIGTNAQAMAAKFPDIYDIFQNKKGDKQNIEVFDMFSQFLAADAQMSEVTKKLGRIRNLIKAETKAQLDAIAETVKQYGQEDLKLDLEIDIEVDEEDMEYVDAMMQDFIRRLQEDQAMIQDLNRMITDSFVQGFADSVQAITDAAFGIEGAGFEQALAAFVKPIANMMKQMGEMYMAYGLAELQLITGTPAQKIAAGAALVAIGSAIASGLTKLSATVGGASAVGAASSTPTDRVETYEQDITIHVVGTISGNDIVLAGQKTLNKWSR